VPWFRAHPANETWMHQVAHAQPSVVNPLNLALDGGATVLTIIPVVRANPQKTVLFLLRICYRTHNMLGIYYHTGDGTELLTS
jgi:hypothetical protein